MPAAPARRPLPLSKKLLFFGFVLLFVYGLLEGASALILLVAFGGPRAQQQLQQGISQALGQGVEPARTDLLHPYQGVIPDGVELGQSKPHPVNRWGFLGENSPLRRRAPGKLIVAVTGGSVARDFTFDALGELADRLQADARYADLQIEFLPLALGGYKQPQQLMAVNYLLALGGEFDLLINLDGFNEIVLSVTENYESGVAPSYPRRWNLRASVAHSNRVRRLVGKSAFLEEKRRVVASMFQQSPLRFSLTATCIWSLWDNRLQSLIVSNSQAIGDLLREEGELAARGPFEPFESEAALYRHCAAVWERSSQQLHELCRAHGADYCHALQPNQYLPGSKPIGAVEARVALARTGSTRRAVEIGYPLLSAAGERLRSAGVRFVDLTNAFREHPQPLYSDNCCHLNREGNEILARRIAEAILAD